MLKAVAKVATVAIVGALALTGCSVTNPQVAAYVDGAPVSQTEVDTVSRVLAESTADPLDTAGSFAPTVLTIIVQSKLAAKTAAEKGITVTEAQRQTVIAQNEVYGTLLGNPATAVRRQLPVTNFMQTEPPKRPSLVQPEARQRHPFMETGQLEPASAVLCRRHTRIATRTRL